MRLIVSTLLALALGFLPGSPARAQDMTATETAMACHDSGGQDTNHSQPVPADDMQACANHCLSHANAQPSFARLTAPPLLNLVSAERFSVTDLGHPRDRDPPEPPPPRI